MLDCPTRRVGHFHGIFHVTIGKNHRREVGEIGIRCACRVIEICSNHHSLRRRLPQQFRQAVLTILNVLQVWHKRDTVALQRMLCHPVAEVVLCDKVDLLQQRHVVHAVVVVPTIFGQCPLVPNRNEPVEKHVDKTGVGAERIQKPAPVVMRYPNL